MRWRLPESLVAIGLIVMFFLPTACHEEQPVIHDTIKPIRIHIIGDSLLKGAREFNGRAEASRSSELSFRVPGRLLEVPVRQGERVAEGQVIARLDPRDFENRVREVQSQLEQARAMLAQMRAGARAEDVNRLQAALAARQSELDGARAELDRYQSLLDQNVVSRQEFDQVKTRFDGAQASLENARQEMAIARTGARPEEIAAQQAQIDGLGARLQEARNNLGDTTLAAPFSGVIARIDANDFEDIQANQPILSLQMTDPIDIVIQITEQDMAEGRSSQSAFDPDLVVAEAQIPALDNEWHPLRVKELQTQADPNTQTFTVILQMDQPSGEPVQPGMNATVRGITAGGDQPGSAIYIPLVALISNPEGNDCVWLIDPTSMRVTAHPVAIGRVIGDQVEVIDGLAPGDQIAASAANLLREGMQVEPLRDLGAL